MDKDSENKRVFFAFEVFSPWPQKLPEGRLLEDNHRHLTIAFLGNIRYPPLEKILTSFPPPDFKVGLVGKFNKTLFLPKKRASVVSWHVNWFGEEYSLDLYQKKVVHWLQSHDYSLRIHEGGFLPHVTICRRPFKYEEWRKAFHPLPLILKDIHLYESLGQLKYEPIWSYRLKSPIEEFEHTADLAFRIRGENLQQVYRHAQVALAFHCPALLPYISEEKTPETLDDIIMDLNALITKADKKQGCPIKAVSFHGELVEEEDQTLMWEMIIDV